MLQVRILTAPLLLAAHLWAGAADSILVKQCSAGMCASLGIERGTVVFHCSGGPVSRRSVGNYIAADQPLVPRTEPPIRDLRFRGWHIVVTALLRDFDEMGPTIRMRVFDPRGRLTQTLDGDYSLDYIRIGELLDHAPIFAATTGGIHSYISSVYLLLLQEPTPKELLNVNGSIDRFIAGGSPGVWLSIEQYDGIHAETKGYKREFWAWDRDERKLTRVSGAFRGHR
jgi:hypothetical protein